MQSEREQNYWPGFVDALSNVVLTLVFVIVIFVFALVMSAAKVEKAMQQVEAQKQQTQAQQTVSQQLEGMVKENQDLRQKLEQAQIEIQKLSAAQTTGSGATVKDVDIDVAQPSDGKLQQKSIGVLVSGDKIVITYPVAVADLDSASSAKLDQLIGDFAKRLGKRKITIRSIGGNEPFSAAQRYAYYRAVSVRNRLIAKNVAEAGAISNVLVPSSETGGDRVEIIFGK